MKITIRKDRLIGAYEQITSRSWRRCSGIPAPRGHGWVYITPDHVSDMIPFRIVPRMTKVLAKALGLDQPHYHELRSSNPQEVLDLIEMFREAWQENLRVDWRAKYHPAIPDWSGTKKPMWDDRSPPEITEQEAAQFANDAAWSARQQIEYWGWCKREWEFRGWELSQTMKAP